MLVKHELSSYPWAQFNVIDENFKLLGNGYDFNAPEDDLFETVMSVAKGDLDKAGVAVFIRTWL